MVTIRENTSYRQPILLVRKKGEATLLTTSRVSDRVTAGSNGRDDGTLYNADHNYSRHRQGTVFGGW